MTRWNWNPEKPLFLDFETQSAADLREVGSYRYLTDPSTRILSLVALVDGVVLVFIPPWAPKVDGNIWPEGYDERPIEIYRGGYERLPELYPDYTFVAHNAEGFDALAWEHLVGGDPQWYDTMPCARAAGLPGALDAIGERCFGRGKHKAGHAAMMMLTRIKKRPPVGTIHVWRDLLRYNIADVLLLEKIFHLTRNYGEADVLAAHCACNGRGIAVDVPYAERLGTLWIDLERESLNRVTTLTDGAITPSTIRSGPKMHAWLATQGVVLQTLQRKELERMYAEPEEYFDGADADLVIEVLKLRQVATRSGKAKINRLLQTVETDGRARRLLRYHRAHTGRWGGSGFQPQNLTKGIKLNVEACVRADLTLDDVRAAAGGKSADDALSTLLRPVLCAAPGKRLLIVDYAAIEARGIAWVAGQDDLLDLFRRNQDVYLDLGRVIFGRPITKKDETERQISKICALGSGYGMSSRKFDAFCKVSGVDLVAAGTSGEACIKAYREKNARIVAVWKAYNSAAFAACRGGSVVAGKCLFYLDSGNLIIRLPSGRELIYRDVSIQKRVPGYAKALGLDLEPRDTVVYRTPEGHEGNLYGGKIAENVVQAVCRDLLATALVRCEIEGLPVVLHVHDEIVCEVEEKDAERSLHRLAKLMTDAPSWAEGFPISVEGYDAPRYVKGAWSDSKKVS